MKGTVFSINFLDMQLYSYLSNLQTDKKNGMNEMKYNLAIFLFLFYLGANLSAEDGSKLWLRYQTNPVSKTESGLSVFSTVVVTEASDVLVSAIDELKIASFQMTDSEI